MESEKPEGLAVKRPKNEGEFMNVELVVSYVLVTLYVCSRWAVMVRFDNLNTWILYNLHSGRSPGKQSLDWWIVDPWTTD